LARKYQSDKVDDDEAQSQPTKKLGKPPLGKNAKVFGKNLD